MRYLWMAIVLSICLFGTACTKVDQKQESVDIIRTLDNWHAAAAKADYDAYFGYFADSAVFIGTDPTENWNIESFRVWSKSFFDRGKAWSFKAVERNIYFSENGKTAWFDELLDTQMKICRGSGVLEKADGNWKIRHYVLSMTVPNENTRAVVEIKSEIEDGILKELLN